MPWSLDLRRRSFLASTAAGIAAAAMPIASRAQESFALGDDVLLRDRLAELADRHVGIITNQSGVLSTGEPVVDALVRAPGVHVRALFGPEHGLRGDHEAGAYVPSYTDERTGLPVYSLYGPTRHPSLEMLAGIDLFLFDIQDVGSRTYTFISTMAYAMQSAAAHGIEFWVLDRPNPVGGRNVEGPVLEPAFSSFIGLYPIALHHGMTVGELARLFNEQFGIGAKLRVITMEGWHRSTIWPQTGLRWIRTSPNIPTWPTCFVYLCTGLIDDMGMNNGVGTPTPFFYAGAPNFDARTYADRLNALGLTGISFDPSVWTPAEGGNAGKAFSGVRLRLTHPEEYLPVECAVHLLVTARDTFAGSIVIDQARPVDIDWGNDSVRRRLLAGASASDIIASWQPRLNDFLAVRERFLLYT
jgi:uncharacterized protein YbbC (DUF1343 family)